MSLITAIIPNYNHSRFLQRRLDSILQQTFQDVEIIILDDASTDNSKDIIEQYRHHPKVKAIVYNENNSGSPIAQWYKGIAMAETEWIWIAESDDTCNVQMLESLQPVFSRQDAVLGMSEVVFINEQDETIMEFPVLAEGWHAGTDFVHRHMLSNCTLCNAGMAVFRKAATPEHGEWVNAFNYSPDYYFWIQLMLQGAIYTNGQKLACFRKHPAEFTAGKYNSLIDYSDHAKMLQLLYLKGSVNSKAINVVAKKKLVSLETQRSGMTHIHFAASIAIWHQLAKDCRMPVNQWEVKWEAGIKKLKHHLGIRY